MWFDLCIVIFMKVFFGNSSKSMIFNDSIKCERKSAKDEKTEEKTLIFVCITLSKFDLSKYYRFRCEQWNCIECAQPLAIIARTGDFNIHVSIEKKQKPLFYLSFSPDFPNWKPILFSCVCLCVCSTKHLMICIQTF